MLLFLAVLTAHTAMAAAKSPLQSVHAVVSQDRGTWAVQYTLPARTKAWVFPVSATTLADHTPWRMHSWRVSTPGVTIERWGNYDVIVSAEGHALPKTVRITFTPTNATLDREYDPAVTFSNGAVALYSDQFDLAPAAGREDIIARDAGLSIEDLNGQHAAVRFHDAAGPVFVRGERQVDPVLTGASTYVVFGAATIENAAGVAMLADPALPAWLKAEISRFVPHVAATYASRLGVRDDPRLPLLLMGWRGPTPGKVVNDGGVRPGQILLNFEGEGLIERNERAARRTLWFIAHEMAHFWLGTEGVAYRAPSDAWITEGGAEMMAFTLLAGSDHAYALSELQRAVDDCIRYGTRPVAGAGDRHESRAFYACGTVFALAAAGAARQQGGADYFDFIRPLLTQHRVDRLVGSSDWLDHFDKVAHNASVSEEMRRLLERGSDHPAATVADILRPMGVPFDAKGDTLVLAPSAI